MEWTKQAVEEIKDMIFDLGKIDPSEYKDNLDLHKLAMDTALLTSDLRMAGEKLQQSLECPKSEVIYNLTDAHIILDNVSHNLNSNSIELKENNMVDILTFNHLYRIILDLESKLDIS